VFKLPPGNSRVQWQVFVDLLKEIKKAVGPIEYFMLAWTLFIRQKWYKIFAKLLLDKMRPNPSIGSP
jgi:hypothetical protein